MAEDTEGCDYEFGDWKDDYQSRARRFDRQRVDEGRRCGFGG